MLNINNKFNIGDKVYFRTSNAEQYNKRCKSLIERSGLISKMNIYYNPDTFIEYTVEVKGEITTYKVREEYLSSKSIYSME